MDLQTATIRLRAMVTAGARISWQVTHANERALKRNVTRQEAERIVRRAAAVVRVEQDGTDLKWRVAGYDSDERPVHVVVVPQRDDVLRVITVIRVDE